GIGYLLEAWRSLRPRSAELVIAGRLPVHPQLHEALRVAGVTVLGRVGQRQLLELFQTSSLFCLPSLVEGFGLVYLQSLACGTPIMGTDATGAADILSEHPEAGLLVDAASVESLALGLE